MYYCSHVLVVGPVVSLPQTPSVKRRKIHSRLTSKKQKTISSMHSTHNFYNKSSPQPMIDTKSARSISSQIFHNNSNTLQTTSIQIATGAEEPLTIWEVCDDTCGGRWKQLPKRTMRRIEEKSRKRLHSAEISRHKRLLYRNNQYYLCDTRTGSQRPVRRTVVQWSYAEPAGLKKTAPTRWYPLQTDVMSGLERVARRGTNETVDTKSCRFLVNERVMVNLNTNHRYRIRRLCQTSNDARPRILNPHVEKLTMERRFFTEEPTRQEKEEITCLFNGDPNMLGFELSDITKINNPELKNGFAHKKRSMGSRHNETMLFHGCPEHVLDYICDEGFDIRLNGKNATQYGKGSYFAKYPSYSHKFSDVPSSKINKEKEREWKMIVCRVAIGQFTQGHKSLVRPPRVRVPDGMFYDSVVDSPKDPHVFVIFEKEQAYPAFVITYKKSFDEFLEESDSDDDFDMSTTSEIMRSHPTTTLQISPRTSPSPPLITPSTPSPQNSPRLAMRSMRNVSLQCYQQTNNIIRAGQGVMMGGQSSALLQGQQRYASSLSFSQGVHQDQAFVSSSKLQISGASTRTSGSKRKHYSLCQTVTMEQQTPSHFHFDSAFHLK